MTRSGLNTKREGERERERDLTQVWKRKARCISMLRISISNTNDNSCYREGKEKKNNRYSLRRDPISLQDAKCGKYWFHCTVLNASAGDALNDINANTMMVILPKI